MKKLLLLITILFAGIMIPARAYDLVVSMVVEETGKKISDIEPMATYPDLRYIASPVKNEADTTYLFKNLPKEKILINYMIEGNLWSKEMPEPADSIVIKIASSLLPKSTVLDEVVVESKNQYMEDDKVVYRPTSTEKKMSANGSALLMNMNISSLQVSPENGSITTSSGDGVSTYINYLPANQNDVANIRTAEVKRVEVYDYPKDPRFGGAKHVVNFIMTQYEYGGYTKLSATQRVIDNMGNYSAYSKMSYKSMTYDAGVTYKYTHPTHNRSISKSIYDFGSDKVELDEESNYYSKRRNLTGFFRSIYQTTNKVISNTFSVNSSKVPGNHSVASEKFSSSSYTSGESRTFEHSKSLGFVWDGNYQFFLPNRFTLLVSPNASYGKNENNYSYESADDAIINDVDEKAWSMNLYASLSKALGRHSITAGLSGEYEGHNLDYAGTNTSDIHSRYFGGVARLQADLKFGKFMIQPSVRMIVTRSEYPENNYNESHPAYYISGTYNINSKNRLILSSELSYYSLPIEYMSPVLQQKSQINAVMGNPNLKTNVFSNTGLYYTLFPVKNLSISTYGRFTRISRLISVIYEPIELDSRQMMLETYGSNGFSNTWSYGVSCSYRMLNNSLNLRGTFNGSTTHQHSSMRYGGTNLNFNLQATYFISGFYISGYYTSESTSVGSSYIQKTPQFYTVMAGWGNGNLNVDLSVRCPFTSSYRYTNLEMPLGNKSTVTKKFATAYHRSVQLTLSYSFSYGKKLQRGNEGKASSGVGSGILK
jgi:hypothetical protein